MSSHMASSLANWAPPAVASRPSASDCPSLTARARPQLAQQECCLQRLLLLLATSIASAIGYRWSPSSEPCSARFLMVQAATQCLRKTAGSMSMPIPPSQELSPHSLTTVPLWANQWQLWQRRARGGIRSCMMPTETRLQLPIKLGD